MIKKIGKKLLKSVTIWYKDDTLHRDNDLPAVMHSDGEGLWYKEGKIHRINGPARVNNSGYEAWYREGHRIPAPKVKSSSEDYEFDSDWDAPLIIQN